MPECGRGIWPGCMHRSSISPIHFYCCSCWILRAECGKGICCVDMHRTSSDSAESTEPNASGDDNRAERDDAERELRKRGRTEGPAGGDSAPA